MPPERRRTRWTCHVPEARIRARRGRPAARRVVVVGSGAVGLYTATELARRGRDVVVVEAGGLALGRFDPGVVPLRRAASRRHRGGRSRTLGGTTNLWGGQLAEFDAIDLGAAPRASGGVARSRSPSSRASTGATYESLGIPDVRPARRGRVEDRRNERPRLGAGSTCSSRAGCPSRTSPFGRETTCDEPDEPPRADGTHGDGVSRAPAHVSTRLTRRRPRRRRSTQSRVRRFVLAAGNDRDRSPPPARGRVVGWPAPWRGQRPGRPRFQDHLGGRIATVHPTDSKRFFKTLQQPARRTPQVPAEVPARPGGARSSEAVNVHGMFAFESSISENLVYLKQFVKAAVYGRKVGGLRSLAANVRASASYLLPLMWTYAKDHRIFEPSTSRISLFVQMEQIPRDDSTIGIDPSRRDRDGPAAGRGRLASRRRRARGAPRLRAPHRPRAAGGGARAAGDRRGAAARRSGVPRAAARHESPVGRRRSWPRRAPRVSSTPTSASSAPTTCTSQARRPSRRIGAANTTFPALALASRLVDHSDRAMALTTTSGSGSRRPTSGSGVDDSWAATASRASTRTGRDRARTRDPPLRRRPELRHGDGRGGAGPGPRRIVPDVTVCTKVGIPRPAYSSTPLRRASLRQADAPEASAEGGRRHDAEHGKERSAASCFSEEAIRSSLAESLERLRRDSVDVFLLHEPGPCRPRRRRRRLAWIALAQERADQGLRRGHRRAPAIGGTRFGSVWQSRWPGVRVWRLRPGTSRTSSMAPSRYGADGGGRRPRLSSGWPPSRIPGCVLLVSASSPGAFGSCWRRLSRRKPCRFRFRFAYPVMS